MTVGVAALVTLVLLLSSSVATSISWPGAVGSVGPKGWCGVSTASDWACRRVGSSSVGDEQLGATPRLLHPHTTVSTTAKSLARLSLQDQARCTLGGSSPSEAITRPGETVILRQILGASACSADHGTVSIHLCVEEGCNRIVNVGSGGTVLGRIFPATGTAIASATEAIHRRVRIVSCSGFVTVGAGGQSASGGPGGHNRFVIEVVETLVRSEGERSEEKTTETSEAGTSTTESSAEAGATSSSTLKVVEIGELDGRGPCSSAAVREGERSVGS